MPEAYAPAIGVVDVIEAAWDAAPVVAAQTLDPSSGGTTYYGLSPSEGGSAGGGGGFGAAIASAFASIGAALGFGGDSGGAGPSLSAE